MEEEDRASVETGETNGKRIADVSRTRNNQSAKTDHYHQKKRSEGLGNIV